MAGQRNLRVRVLFPGAHRKKRWIADNPVVLLLVVSGYLRDILLDNVNLLPELIIFHGTISHIGNFRLQFHSVNLYLRMTGCNQMGNHPGAGA